MSVGRLLAFFVLCGAALIAQPQLTTVQDTLYQANGTLMNATAVITWYSFQASDSTSVGMQSLTVPIVNGAIYVQLVPNTTATPSQPYTVMYESNGYIQYEETWMVPPSSTPLRVQAVRTSSTVTTTPAGTSPGSGTTNPPAGGAETSSTPIPESDVTGLTSDLAARPLKGAGYGANRVAIVDQNGNVETVVGNDTDCVYVNGTSGPCFDPTQLPGYSDSETPTGVVDGSNVNFGLIGTPAPALSLLLFRNGMLQKQGFDYSLSGQAIQFAANATPQPGDTLLASYRLPPAAVSGSSGDLNFDPNGGSSNGVVVFPVFSPQTICSATGTTTTSATPTTLGTCTIPGNFLGSGDRVEIRFLLSHTGAGGTINYGVVWGATTLLNRSGGVNDAMIAGRMDASATSGPTQVSGESYGSVLVDLPFFAAAPDSLAAPITMGFQGSVALGSDTLGLVNYTVIRYPAVSHP